MENLDNEFIKGFNEGYLIKQHESSLADSLAKIEGNTDRVKGIQAGIEQYSKDNDKGHYPSWFNNISTSKTLTKDSTPEKDLDIDRE